MLLRFLDVSFSHENASSELFRGVTVHFSQGWTGIVGANGTGKTTLLRLACGELSPQQGQIQAIGTAVYCPQRTDDAPSLFESFLQAMDREACRLRGSLAIEADWAARWSTLSHGERKRAQIAVALWKSPEILAIDEPTNHIDAPVRHLLSEALASFSGIGLLVSHDRALLDTLCQSCLFTTPSRVVLRPGGYSQASVEAKRERESLARKREQTKKSLQRLEKEHRNRRHKAAQADKKSSKRGIPAKDHDAKERINRARLSGKDGQAGRLTAQLKGRTQHLRQALEDLKLEKTHEIGIWLPGSRSRRKSLFSMPSGTIPLGSHRRLQHPPLGMAPDDRVGVTGPSGAGKSLLLGALLSVFDLPTDAVVYLPQELDKRQSREMLDRVRCLSQKELGHVMTIVNRLGTRPQRLLETCEPSPGELRKIMLALGVIKSPHLVVMDEPTNHLDLPAIECLERALSDCPCGLLLVSHDYTFLRSLTSTRWDIRDDRLTIREGWTQL
jgi:ATPase subunit of ABC transporter with duplicated ATPase domains